MLADLGFQARGCVCPSVCVCASLSKFVYVCVSLSINSFFHISWCIEGGQFSSVAFVPPEGRCTQLKAYDCKQDGSSAFLAA